MMDINIVGRMTGKLEKEIPLLAASLILPQNQLEEEQREKVLPTLSCQYFSTQRETKPFISLFTEQIQMRINLK